MKYYRIIRKKDNIAVVTTASYTIITHLFREKYNKDNYKLVIIVDNKK